jgi:biopolymer transport protein ExbB
MQSLDQLLKQVESSIRKDQHMDQQRLDEFLANQQAQAKLLKQAKQRLKQAKATQAQLKDQYDQNEASLTELSERLTQRSGQLGEVFGVVKQQAQDLSGVIQDSLITSEGAERLSLISFADQKRVPTTADMKNLWLLMLQEMTATSEVKTYNASVAQPDGEYQPASVLRVGPFVAIDDQGRFLKYDPDHQQLAVFARQPDFVSQRQAEAFYHQRSELVLVDPSRGNLLELIGRTPTVKERIEQAGSIGVIIITLGIVGLLVALWRLIAVLFAELKTRRQLKQVHEPQSSNALGRVLVAVKDAKVDAHDTTSIEIRVDEALLKEVPRLEFGMNLLKLLAAVAPLLGLLGTVVGMIGTFQSITVFGTSDPKLMAGGISQALMTTVLGLCVAIPLLFSHSLVAARVKRLIQLLQQEAFSAMADTMESRIPAASTKVKTQ